MNDLTFDQYFERFDKVIKGRGGKIIKLGNGASVGFWGEGKRVAINSGIHGDERSGPLAILEWIEQKKEISGIELVLSPLTNDCGWDRKTRNWNETDLNTVFNVEGPKFVQELMEIWRKKIPTSLLDIHEDDEQMGPYLFRLEKADERKNIELARVLGARIEDWVQADWGDSSESYVRRLGCNQVCTIESPPIWQMLKRIKWNKKAIEWWIENS